MRKSFACFLFTAALLGGTTAALAGELSIKIANGRATIIAKEVPVRQILAEWARVGETKVVNGEKVVGGPVTLELIDVPEKEALDILLRTAAGYIAAPRPANLTGASQFDRVIVLATSRPPAAAPMAPQPFGRPNMQQIQPQLPPQPPPDDDDGEPEDQGPMPPGAVGPNGAVQMVPGVNTPTVIMGPNGPMNVPPGPNGMPANVPVTSPRPGALPAQPEQLPPNPYAPQGRPGPGVPRPATPGDSDQ